MLKKIRQRRSHFTQRLNVEFLGDGKHERGFSVRQDLL
jgi:hypothetical protein